MKTDSPATSPAFTPPPAKTPRHMGWAPASAICCSQDHHQKERFFIIDHGGLRCLYVEPDPILNPDKRECGRLLYVLSVREYELTFYAEVTLDEMREIQRIRAVFQILEYLGARFPVEARTPRKRSA